MMASDNKRTSLYWTRELAPGDGRLKVLWIEDNPDGLIPNPPLDLENWFVIICIKGPVELKTFIEESASEGAKGDAEGAAPVYSLRGVPSDVYLTDFRLCDKVAEGCKSPEHLDLGLHAPSGGFLLGLLTSLHFPKHPQVIIPYSAWDEEFGQIWKLASAAVPPSVRVLWEKSGGKAKRNTAQLIDLIAPQYRETLRVAFRNGLVHMPLRERDRWELILGAAGSSSQDKASAGRLDPYEKVWLFGEYGARPILLGALFHELLRGGREPWIPASEVANWLTTDVPGAQDPLEETARLLAQFYWKLRCSHASQHVYTIVKRRSLGVEEPVPPVPPAFPSLISWKTGAEGKRLVRLAFLFLLIEEHCFVSSFETVQQLSEKSEESLVTSGPSFNIQTIQELVPSLLQRYPNLEELRDRLLQLAVEQGITPDSAFEERLEEIRTLRSIGGLPLEEKTKGTDIDVFSLSELPSPLSEASVIQLVDPLPSRWDQPLTLSHRNGIGKAIAKLWSSENIEGKQSELYDMTMLLKGDSSQLTLAEQLCARNYARELIASDEYWPIWLKQSFTDVNDMVK